MRSIFLFLFLLFSTPGLLSQKLNDYDKILKTENLPFHQNEIRVYKKYAISTGLEMFRFYQDDREHWKAELFETVASKDEQGQVRIRIKTSKLNSLKNPELVWIQILDTDVLDLPTWEHFRYKLEKKNKKYEIEDGVILSSTTVSSVLDGVSYDVKIKNQEKENIFSYNNPESYLKTYPGVDELLSFRELLDLLRNDFKVFQEKQNKIQ